ncbi:germination protein, Ger(x)C family [Ammonifex degensii KC4]|uniref:Germination protein, Ger(X)C family n=1 Tax=Ammonifex degensii (strain DSM 10501 / KC4) TaxID=429009 RepID=C9RB34_AMMDK|nr:Ger(x)C family spore germination protein [Ammonifex degensii]ACX51461.1 germination protein, Ger(x)C family [Ammonifex degensii KC4]
MRCLLACLTVGFLLLSGCWDMRELEDLAFVTAVAVDWTPGREVRLIAQVFNPRALAGGAQGAITPGASISSKSYRNYEARGKTVFAAMRELALKMPKRPYFAQSRVLLLTEETARQGVAEVLDFFERSVEIRKIIPIFVVRGDILEFLDVPNPHDICPATRLEDLVREQSRTSFFPAVTLGEFLGMLVSEGQEAYCPVVRVERNPTRKLRPGELLDPAPEPAMEIKVGGTAVFRRGRLVGFLNEQESRGLLWTKGKVGGGALVLSLGGNKEVTVDVLRSQARIRPHLTPYGPKFTVEIREEGNVAEAACPLDLSKLEVMRQLEAAQAAAIKEEVEQALRRAKELKADIFGFGAALHRHYPQEWKKLKQKWPEEVFPYLEVEVKVDARLRRTGLRSKSLPQEIKLIGR